jgi:hypothetical protein
MAARSTNPPARQTAGVHTLRRFSRTAGWVRHRANPMTPIVAQPWRIRCPVDPPAGARLSHRCPSRLPPISSRSDPPPQWGRPGGGHAVGTPRHANFGCADGRIGRASPARAIARGIDRPHPGRPGRDGVARPFCCRFPGLRSHSGWPDPKVGQLPGLPVPDRFSGDQAPRRLRCCQRAQIGPSALGPMRGGHGCRCGGHFMCGRRFRCGRAGRDTGAGTGSGAGARAETRVQRCLRVPAAPIFARYRPPSY